MGSFFLFNSGHVEGWLLRSILSPAQLPAWVYSPCWPSPACGNHCPLVVRRPPQKNMTLQRHSNHHLAPLWWKGGGWLVPVSAVPHPQAQWLLMSGVQKSFSLYPSSFLIGTPVKKARLNKRKTARSLTWVLHLHTEDVPENKRISKGWPGVPAQTESSPKEGRECPVGNTGGWRLVRAVAVRIPVELSLGQGGPEVTNFTIPAWRDEDTFANLCPAQGQEQVCRLLFCHLLLLSCL